MEVVAPFVYKNLGVTVEAEKLVTSNFGHIYVDNGASKNVFESDNPYDIAIRTNMNYAMTTGTEDLRSCIYKISKSLATRFSSTIAQNINIIFNNGLGSFLRSAIKPDTDPRIISDLVFIVVPEHHISEQAMYLFAKNKSCGIGFHNYPFNDITDDDTEFLTNLPENETIVGDKGMKFIADVIAMIANSYENIVNRSISSEAMPYIDLDSIADYAMRISGVDTSTVDNDAYFSLATSYLNFLAVDDLEKIREIISLNLTQVYAQYFNMVGTLLDSGKIE